MTLQKSVLLMGMAGAWLAAGCGDDGAACPNPDPTDGCCPSGGNQLVDDDCSPSCGNGAIESNESCDTAIPAGSPGACPQTPADCDDELACTIDSVSGSSCGAACDYTPVSDLVDGDGCCPEDATSATDSDCSPACGNGVVEDGETCDTAISSGAGACPSPEDCVDDDACTATEGVMSAGTCQATCYSTPITMPMTGDGCCPLGANANTDGDCTYTCGDGALEPGEACDVAIPAGLPGACPSPGDCDDADACTIESIAGAGCAARCEYETTTAPTDGDGCCPEGGNANNDSDCLAVCGNGVYEPAAGESCDVAINSGAGSCATDCSDGNACTEDVSAGSGCGQHCTNTFISQCVHGDGCCVAGCTFAQDDDCSATCGNGVVDAGETCDTAIVSGPGACPTPESCEDGDACTTHSIQSGGTCQATCVSSDNDTCTNGDGCCPVGCDSDLDDDCSQM